LKYWKQIIGSWKGGASSLN